MWSLTSSRRHELLLRELCVVAVHQKQSELRVAVLQEL